MTNKKLSVIVLLFLLSITFDLQARTLPPVTKTKLASVTDVISNRVKEMEKIVDNYSIDEDSKFQRWLNHKYKENEFAKASIGILYYELIASLESRFGLTDLITSIDFDNGLYLKVLGYQKTIEANKKNSKKSDTKAESQQLHQQLSLQFEKTKDTLKGLCETKIRERYISK